MPGDARAEDRPDEDEPADPGRGAKELGGGGRRTEGHAHHGEEFGQRPGQPTDDILQPGRGAAARSQWRGHGGGAVGQHESAIAGCGHVHKPTGARETELVADRPAGPRGHRAERGEQDHGRREGRGGGPEQEPPGKGVTPADLVDDRAGRVRARGHGSCSSRRRPLPEGRREREYKPGGLPAPPSGRGRPTHPHDSVSPSSSPPGAFVSGRP